MEALSMGKTDDLELMIEDIIKNYHESPEDICEFLKFRGQFNNYSMRNTMLIYKQNSGATFVGSFLKWKSLGYSVKKGEQGYRILTPAKMTFFKLTEESDWKRLKDASAAEKKLVKQGVYTSLEKTVFVVGNVFDITQTTCPVADYPKLYHRGYPSKLHNAIYNIIKKRAHDEGISVYETDTKSIALNGYYSPPKQQIHISNRLTDTARLSTLIHEYSHALLHSNPHINISVAQGECEADAMSMLLHSKIGIDVPDGRKSHFLQNYAICSREKDFSLKALLNSANDRYAKLTADLEPMLEQCQSITTAHQQTVTSDFTMEMI